MIGIIAAMQLELEGLKSELTEARETRVGSLVFTEGKLRGLDVVLSVCGIGKVNAALCAQSMILLFKPECVINTGVGGALDSSLRVCDVVCAEYAVQHDFDTSPLGDEVGFVSTVNILRFPVDAALRTELINAMTELNVSAVCAGIATGDQFVCSADDKKRISELFGCKVCEMEGAAIAHACYVNSVPCAILRAISDGADEGSPMSYTEFAGMAAARSVKVLLKFLENRNAVK